ncbi:MAG TPA: hypothetical protein EYG46_19600 [Myxococcales bacterium]|nr:hypothetical protein [Myxococcales bacterium]
MIELICFVRRKEGMDRDAFHEHWLNHHGPLIRNTPELSKYVLRYEQNHRTDRDSERDRGSAGHDGVTIQWFENMQAFIGFCTDPAYYELIAPDEAKFLDRSAFHIFFAAEPIVQMPVQEERGTLPTHPRLPPVPAPRSRLRTQRRPAIRWTDRAALRKRGRVLGVRPGA